MIEGIETTIIPAPQGVELAIQYLTGEEVVALPTETVYGLAGNALSEVAIKKIFEAKNRPFSDPLILHLLEASWLNKVVDIQLLTREQQQLVEKLAAHFWPGPLTLLLPKKKNLSPLVTAGSDFVAVRVPSHPLFCSVLEGINFPLAAPSANRFGRISPTQASDVLEELGGKIPLILEGGVTAHGVESTILELRGTTLQILRPGPVTLEMLTPFARVESNLSRKKKINLVPGMLPSHYAPSKPLFWLTPKICDLPASEQSDLGLLAFSEQQGHFGAVELLSAEGSLEEAAHSLYAAMRRLDQASVRAIVVEPLSEEGIGIAIMDRLRRAAAASEAPKG